VRSREMYEAFFIARMPRTLTGKILSEARSLQLTVCPSIRSAVLACSSVLCVQHVTERESVESAVLSGTAISCRRGASGSSQHPHVPA
jgi:hypothetical protein